MKTVFIRAIEASVDDKAAVIRAAARGSNPARFDLNVSTFGSVPRSPFAYWVGDAARSIFVNASDFSFDAKCGMGTLDDFRFLRLDWEATSAGRLLSWRPFAKGGVFSPFYSDIYLLVDWAADGAELKTFVEAKVGSASRKIQATSFYFRPGLTWPRRTQGGLSLRVMPRGCIFADKGPAAFVASDEPQTLLALAAVTNSRPFHALVNMQMAFGSYEVGVIQRTPVPKLEAVERNVLARLARRSWSLTRQLDAHTENSHAFLLPALLQTRGEGLAVRVADWTRHAFEIRAELDRLRSEIDLNVYRLYGISAEERQRIEQGFGSAEIDGDAESDDEDGDDTEEAADTDTALMVASLLSWSLGVAFGRFDVRLATGERPPPSEPEPFDPLPVCSPGMLTDDNGLPVQAPPARYPMSFPMDAVFVDDPGHARDLTGAVRSVFDTIFDEANAQWHEAEALLGVQDLRTWFAADFFEPHIKRYSRSRRRAPIYWQFSTPSGSYSVWLYIHRATGDTLFRVLNDLLGPKLDHEQAKLNGLIHEAGAYPSAAQRRGIDQQQTFVSELQALKAEMARVAPLWSPDLDDGILLNFAPFWRLVPQHRGWQTECRKAWDKLTSGEYDWTHLAMRLWPERVVPKCIDDRSLAIAHGLEDGFWQEDASGAWCKRRVDESTIRKLIAERTSSTVKAALKDLLSAPTAVAGNDRKAGGRRAARAKVPLHLLKYSPTDSPTEVSVDEATLGAVKSAIARVVEGASKADVLAATGLSEADWNKAIALLLDRGDVSRTGQKRGTRYHASPGGEGE